LQDSARDYESSSHGRCNSRDDGLYPPSYSHPNALAYPVYNYRDPSPIFLGVALVIIGATQRFMNLCAKSPILKAMAIVLANSIVKTASTDNQLRH
jgi:hypothetical protein